MAAAALEDPEPYVPGSFDELAAAYDRGELTRKQYRALAEAVAESLRAEDQRAEDERAEDERAEDQRAEDQRAEDERAEDEPRT
jgi:hypothetical protein